MKPEEILDQTRTLIYEHADGDPDKWWYANRYVFARLQVDERKTKTDIKRALFENHSPCHYCGQPFESRRNVHLHRLDGSRGYAKGNCVLMHGQCHIKCHAEQPSQLADQAQQGVITKESKRYEDKRFLYWWDIAPNFVERMDAIDTVEFVKKDSGERCCVPTRALQGFLTPERHTSRGQGNWGLKILKDHEDELAFEPGTAGGNWMFLPVVWIDERSDD